MYDHRRDTDGGAALARARRALIAGRLPLLGAVWIGIGIALRTGLVARGELAIGTAVVSILLQTGVFAVAILLCRRDPEGPHVRHVVFATWAVLFALAAGFFLRLGGSVEGFVFALLLLCAGPALAFAWGWRPTAVLLGMATVTAAAVLPSLRWFSDPTEIVLESLIGAAICLTVAEASAQSFARAFEQERVRAEHARRLAASYAAYRDLADNARDLIYTHDLDARITYVNEAFARFFGTSVTELIGRRTVDLVPREPPNPEPLPLIARALAGEELPPQVLWVNTPHGKRWLEVIVSTIVDADGTVVGLRGIARDVTERRNAEEALRESLEELRRSEERLRRLAGHQARIREEERKRLGFDLHDDVCQELVGIGILVESLRRRVAEATPELAAELARIGGYVGEVGEHLRELARDLRPMLLRDLGLEGSLRSLADAMTTAGTPATVAFPTTIPRLDEQTEIGVYRIAQEALANAVRHAGPCTIRIALSVHGGKLLLAIVDDGCGFAPAVRRGSEALGLIGMEERALALGGRLEVRSAAGEGTSVRLECPVAVRASAA
jgi:PAS domain S-box-containing protein